jgi:anti-sigma-K factor RskA
MSEPMDRLDCAAVDELDAAFALGAVDSDELAAVADHLATCDKPHAELRSLIGAADVMAASLDPVIPSPQLRERLMATVAATPQEHASAAAAPSAAAPSAAPAIMPRRGLFDWLSPGLARGLAAAAVIVALAFAGWNVALQGQMSQRDRALQEVAQAIASGQSAFRVSGSGGSGYVVADASGGARLVVANLAPLQDGRIYELWLIGADQKPVAVGTFAPPAEEVAVVPLERGVSGFAVFAITVEQKRVDSPTLPIVMSGKVSS